jgi:hypothetical protein
MQKKSGYEVYIGDPPFCTITFKGLFLAVLAHYPPHYIQTRTFSPIKSMRSPSAPHFFQVTSKSFNFAAKHKLPFFFVSASDGTNVVKIFQLAMRTGIKYQAEPKEDFYQEVLDLLGEIRCAFQYALLLNVCYCRQRNVAIKMSTT